MKMTRAGTTVGSIRIESLLGSGGMGDVYLGFDQKLERRVAVKTLQPGSRIGERRRERFLREARLLSRLGHPSICQVYDLVETPDADYLVLEYVPGRTLREVLDEKPPLLRQLALAEQIARALAAAHRERIVHRDLKADNIMVTPEWEIKILDFGIARSLETAEPGDALDAELDRDLEDDFDGRGGPRSADVTQDIGLPHRLRTPAPHPGDATRVVAGMPPPRVLTRRGLVVGTLSAMSPEQVTGQPVDEASDLYALGVLLHELFTGERPYGTAEGDELLRRVTRAETEPIDGIDADLERLVGDLESLDPKRRPSADTVAERLHWVAERPLRERRRRLRNALLAAAFVALAVGLAVVGRLAYVASRARAEAEARRSQAETLIDFMLGDLRDKLAGVGRLELLDAVGDRALDYFDRLPEREMTVTDLAHRIKTILQIGEVRRAQGKNTSALQAFARAQALGDQAAALHPGDRDIAVERANALSWIGQMHYDQGEAPPADAAWSRALAIVEGLVAGHPADSELVALRATRRHDLGTVREMQDDLTGALALYDASLADLRRVAAGRPVDRATQAELANTLGFVSVVRERQGDLEAARRDRGEYLAILERLLAAEPADATLLHDTAVARGFVANLLLHFGARDEARALLAQGLETMDALAVKDAANADLQRWRAVFRLALADGAPAPEALGLLRTACPITDALGDGDPENTDFRLQRGLCHARSALVIAEQGVHPAAARAEIDRAAEVLAPLLAAGGRERLPALAAAEVLLGRAAERLGAGEEARTIYERVPAMLADETRPMVFWRLLAPWSEAMLRLDRAAEARDAVESLRGLGFARADWLRLAQNKLP